MQIWRMNADGTGQEQVTKDDAENWFPHVSPDGRSMVFLTYEKGVGDHPENKDVMLKLMNLKTGRWRCSRSCLAARARSTSRPGRRTVSTWRSSAIRWCRNRLWALG